MFSSFFAIVVRVVVVVGVVVVVFVVVVSGLSGDQPDVLLRVNLTAQPRTGH